MHLVYFIIIIYIVEWLLAFFFNKNELVFKHLLVQHWVYFSSNQKENIIYTVTENSYFMFGVLYCRLTPFSIIILVISCLLPLYLHDLLPTSVPQSSQRNRHTRSWSE